MKYIIAVSLALISFNSFAFINYKENTYFDEEGLMHTCHSECVEFSTGEKCNTTC